jgi:hypothetical protein
MNVLDEVVADLQAKWQEAGHRSACRLLRLEVLRELASRNHAALSRELALGTADASPELSQLDAYLEVVADQKATPEQLSLLESDLSRWIERGLRPGTHASVKTPVEPSKLPKELLQEIPQDRFERRDRRFERAIALEACRQNWHFWALEITLPIRKVETWNRDLIQKLWPLGVILFVEATLPSTPETPQGELSWRGRWHLVLCPSVSQPIHEIPVSGPGIDWTLLYPKN